MKGVFIKSYARLQRYNPGQFSSAFILMKVFYFFILSKKKKQKTPVIQGSCFMGLLTATERVIK